MSTGVEKIAEKARQDEKVQFTSLAHHLTQERLWESLKQIPVATGVGVDRQDVNAAKESFSHWSEEMLSAVHRRGYRPPPTRRVYIPKPGKAQKRPIAVPTVQDRALQKSVADVLNAIYEQDFLNCSYGGRPGRDAHQALATLHTVISTKKVGWVLEADLKNFFGSLSQDWVERFLSHRVGDPRIATLVRRWLKAGVLEDGQYHATKEGTAQGGPISVLISNFYLHYVLDLWIEKVVKPRMKGEVYYIRYLDDFVVCFQYRADAIRFRKGLSSRLSRFSLELESSKTRLAEFGRFSKKWAKVRGKRPETIYFLGMTLYCGENRQGRFKLCMRTEKDRLRRSCAKMKATLQRYRHLPVQEQAKAINVRLRGHYQYYGVADNWQSLDRFYYFTLKYWRKMLSSRSQNGKVNWVRYNRILRLFPLRKPKLSVPYTALRQMARL